MQPIFTWHARRASDQVQIEGVAQRYRYSEGGDKMWDYVDKTGELYSQFKQQQRLYTNSHGAESFLVKATNSISANQEIPRILWNYEIH